MEPNANLVSELTATKAQLSQALKENLDLKRQLASLKVDVTAQVNSHNPDEAVIVRVYLLNGSGFSTIFTDKEIRYMQVDTGVVVEDLTEKALTLLLRPGVKASISTPVKKAFSNYLAVSKGSSL